MTDRPRYRPDKISKGSQIMVDNPPRIEPKPAPPPPPPPPAKKS